MFRRLVSLRTPSPGVRADGRYRTVPEAQIVDMLLVAAFVYELEAGHRDAAVACILASLDRWVKLGLGYQRAATEKALLMVRGGSGSHAKGFDTLFREALGALSK